MHKVAAHRVPTEIGTIFRWAWRTKNLCANAHPSIHSYIKKHASSSYHRSHANARLDVHHAYLPFVRRAHLKYFPKNPSHISLPPPCSGLRINTLFPNQSPRPDPRNSFTMSRSFIPRGLATERRMLSTLPIPAAEISSPEVVSPATSMGAGVKKMDNMPLYRRLLKLGQASEGSVSRTMNKLVREGKVVRVNQLIKHVMQLRNYRRYRHALELMDWMVKTAGMNLSHTNSATCLDLICKVRGIESAEQFFDALPGPAKNERTFGTLLNCYCTEKLAEKANSLFEKMKDLKIPLNALAHNNLMAMYQRLGQHEKVVAAFHNLKASNVAPNNLSYCILMQSYASVGEIEAVEGVVMEMEDDDEVVVQWSAYSTLAAIYNYADMHKKAESALKKLESLNDGSERELFHYLISLYAGAGNLEEVRRVWKLLKTTFNEQTNKSYLAMLHALNKLDDIEGMKQCFEEWKSVAVAYDLRIPNLLIAAFLRNDMEGEASAVLEKAKARKLLPDSRTCQLFMDYYLKNGKINLAAKYCEVAASELKKGDDWKLDEEKMDVFLKHFEEAGDVEGMEKLCASLKKLGCTHQLCEGQFPNAPPSLGF